MELRPIRLPEDFTELGGMICDTFQYPENPDWSVQKDEKEQIGQAIRTFKKLWPLFKILSVFSPSMRDIFRGVVAIEDGRIVGVTIIQRRGTTSSWIVGTVGVLPEYRRRGLARKGLEQALQMMKDHGATKTWLGVINGNTPAQRLYESMDFEIYDGTLDYTLKDPEFPTIPSMPAGYTLSKLKRSDWKTRFDLEKRIAPEETRKYEPIEKGRFKTPLMLRLMIPLLNLLQRERDEDFIVSRTSSGEIVGRIGFSVSLRGKGVNTIRIRLDPAHPEPANHVIGLMLQKIVARSPKLRIETGIARWMPAVVEAAESYGFVKRVEYLKMGRML